jgi:hypothetical protein
MQQACRHSWFIELVQLRFPPVAGNTGPMKDSPYWTLEVREKSLELAIYRLRFLTASVLTCHKRLKFFFNKRLKYFVFNFLCSEKKLYSYRQNVCTPPLSWK